MSFIYNFIYIYNRFFIYDIILISYFTFKILFQKKFVSEENLFLYISRKICITK